MKFKTTAKAIRSEGGNIIALGYCDGCHLFHYHDPVAYTCGVYGWNFDVYSIYPEGKYNPVTICTGYRGMVGRSPKVSIREYEEKARLIVYNWSIPLEEKRGQVEKLLNEWLEKA